MSIKILTSSLVVDYGINYDLDTFLNSFEFFLLGLIIVNFWTILRHPTGMYTIVSNGIVTSSNWFLGYKNNHILFIMPALMISLINSYHKYYKIGLISYLVMALSIATLYFNH